jgi:hypothetical protein
MGARARAVYRGADGSVHYLSSTAESSVLIVTDPAVGMTKIPFDGPCRLVPRSPLLPAGYDAVDYESVGVSGSTMISVSPGGVPSTYSVTGVCISCVEGPHDYSLWPVCPMGDRVSYGQHDGEVGEVARVRAPRSEPVEEPEPAVDPEPGEPVEEPAEEPEVPPVAVEVERDARALGVHVWGSGSMRRSDLYRGKRSHDVDQDLAHAQSMQWVLVDDQDRIVRGENDPRQVSVTRIPN